MKNSMPTIPMSLPPKVTAASTQIEGSPTDEPHMGIDQVSLHLLEDQEEDDEQQGLPGIGNGDEQSAHSAADESAHDGNKSGQGNQHTTSKA